ncbi:MAG: Mfa1 family fimbria major subunit [Prevotellaceae bacterium]|nr:Mfa1 family fimbria major subunit [Prevotellaceae bacterium]
MKKISSIIRWTLFFALAMSFAACSMMEVENIDNNGDNPEVKGDGAYLILNFSSSTRATNHPFGSENGDGRESAHNYENKVDNLCFFIYNDGAKKFNEANGNTTFTYKAYIDNINYEGVREEGENVIFPPKRFHIEAYYPKEGDRIMVLINAGNLTYKIKTIDDLRNAQITKQNTWTSAKYIKDYNSFAMTSCTDDDTYGKIEITDKDGKKHAGSYDDPFVARVDVERVAARVDWVLPEDGSHNPIVDPTWGAVYETKADDGIAGKLYVSDIRMVNENQMPTYLIRRIATSVNPLVGENYMGKVTLDTKELPQQYVVEPLTTEKIAGKEYNEELLDTWFGASRFKNSMNATTFFPAGNDYKVGFNATNTADNNYKRFETDFIDNKKCWCYTLGYLMENTMDKSEYTNSNLRTGLQLKCTFLPQDIYQFPEGATVPVRLENTGDNYKIGRSFCYLKNTADVKKSLFFDTNLDATRYLSIQGDKENYEIYNYENGACYYYIWLKHAACDNASDEGNYPMEYAIVRNNIYRIKIEKILHLGTAEPEDVKEALIEVLQWNLRIQPTIYL